MVRRRRISLRKKASAALSATAPSRARSRNRFRYPPPLCPVPTPPSSSPFNGTAPDAEALAVKAKRVGVRSGRWGAQTRSGRCARRSWLLGARPRDGEEGSARRGGSASGSERECASAKEGDMAAAGAAAVVLSRGGAWSGTGFGLRGPLLCCAAFV
jgi:hypothetical protein